MTEFPPMECRKCGRKNPWVYFGPVYVEGMNSITGRRESGGGLASCVCYTCADTSGWLDRNGNLKPGYKA